MSRIRYAVEQSVGAAVAATITYLLLLHGKNIPLRSFLQILLPFLLMLFVAIFFFLFDRYRSRRHTAKRPRRRWLEIVVVGCGSIVLLWLLISFASRLDTHL